MRHLSRRTAEGDHGPTTTGDVKSEAATDILEVWFSGCHSGMCGIYCLCIPSTIILLVDVGGGAVDDSTTQSLANITLRWMLRQVLQSDCGIIFDNAALIRLNLPPITVPTPNAPSPTEIPDSQADLDEVDALQPLHDELKITPLWWLLEILPMKFSWQDAQGNWHTTWR